jgi:hypothetical protein
MPPNDRIRLHQDQFPFATRIRDDAALSIEIGRHLSILTADGVKHEKAGCAPGERCGRVVELNALRLTTGHGDSNRLDQ